MAAPDFDEKTKRIAADRVGSRCTICDTPTHGPNDDPKKATNLGEAAHIRGKKKGAARYDESMNDAQRADIENALWACGNCHGKFDKDFLHYKPETLRNFRTTAEDRARERQCRLSESPVKPLISRIPQMWCHETTNDHTYVRRPSKLGQLNAWFNDPGIRAISLIGIGGAGKTALMGYWLKVDNQDLVREVRGLFYWSFYVEKDVDQFLLALIEFIEKLGTNVEFKFERTDPLGAIERHFPKLPPLVLSLDGLEVLQQAVSEGRTYGSFIDAKLRDFIQLVAYAKLPWLCISTSRFPITDFSRTPNTKSLTLVNLEEEEGAEVLNQNSVLGTEDDRRKVSRYLEGHPLALRIFAASIPKEQRTAPYQHLRNVFDGVVASNPFLDKLFRLLYFYSGTLDSAQRAIIQALSLFRSPVPLRTLAIIVPKLTDKWAGGVGSLDLDLTTELSRLVVSGLVIRDRRAATMDVYACHPIVRDYFRRDLISQGDAGRAAIDILTSRPDDLGIQGATNLEPLLLACEALLLSGDAVAAVELYVNRFEKGRVFLAGGLLTEGKRLYDALERFAADHPDILANAQENLATRRKTNFDATYFRNGAILFNILLGELADAERLINLQLNESAGARRATTYNHQALLSYSKGDYAFAAQLADTAIRATMQTSPVGVTTLIHAQAHYIRIKAFILLGLDRDARKAHKALLALQQQFDSEDGRILLPLAHLWLAARDNRDGCSEAVKRVRSMVPNLDEDHLALEAQLIAARWYILDQRPGQHARNLISEVYRRAVKQSYPYFMISSLIMREYQAYYLGKQCSRDALQQAATLAEASQMHGLQAEALWVQFLLEDNQKVKDSIHQNVDQLANRLGYAALSKIYPARVRSD